ncbi:MAG TPA: iron-containing alcohol dehydrogenase [Gemmataceae bacterium]|nr:iron-containing alcohol dehydrogenase [Gemmataceae bacterium]
MKTASQPGAAGSLLGTSPGGLPAFDYFPLTRVVFGAGTLSRLGELAREYGGSRVLLVTDPGLEEAGHPQRALDVLRGAGLEAFLFDGVEENPTDRHVRAGLEAARANRVDFLVAVGGGSSMDCAKGINFLLTNGGRMADYKGFNKAARPMLPSVAVPTTAGTGSEAQSYALIADEKTHMKMACGDRKAAFRATILDPEVTVSQPARVTAITGIDALAHAVESYVCTRRNPLSQMFARQAWALLELNLETVLRNPAHLEARGAMQVGAHFAGIAIENSMLGACHACANPLTAHYGLTHGVAIGILLPHVIRFNAAAVGALYADLAHEAGLVNGDLSVAAEALARRVTDLMRAAGLPTTLSGCGVSATILPLLAEEAAEQWTGRFNPRPVGEAELLHLYEAAY